MLIKRCFFIRHQAGGVLTDRVFVERPTEADLSEAQARMAKVHGSGHPKYSDPEHPKHGQPWWVAVEESCLVVPDACSFSSLETVDLPPDPRGADQAAPAAPGDGKAVMLVAAGGIGTVRNP